MPKGSVFLDRSSNYVPLLPTLPTVISNTFLSGKVSLGWRYRYQNRHLFYISSVLRMTYIEIIIDNKINQDGNGMEFRWECNQIEVRMEPNQHRNRIESRREWYQIKIRIESNRSGDGTK